MRAIRIGTRIVSRVMECEIRSGGLVSLPIDDFIIVDGKIREHYARAGERVRKALDSDG